MAVIAPAGAGAASNSAARSAGMQPAALRARRTATPGDLGIEKSVSGGKLNGDRAQP
jgi:hypothetical protein